jgi:hypothetical protein
MRPETEGRLMDLIHSKFLVHWTGKSIATTVPLSDHEAHLYTERLKKILTEGLYVRCPTEEEAKRERAFGNTWGQHHSFDVCFARLCFTEIRLSQARAHAQRYGLLGIGFDREFVMARNGNPVFYIQNGVHGVAAEMFARMRGYLVERLQGGDQEAKGQIRQLEVLMGFTRTMNEQDRPDLKYYDEMEWRILHSDGGERAGHFKRIDNVLWLMPFKPSDVTLIVFPTPQVKQLALRDCQLQEIFGQEHSPMLLTLDDCAYF